MFLYHLHFLWRISALNEIDNDRIDWTDISLNLKGLDTNVIHDTLMDLQQTQEETEVHGFLRVTFMEEYSFICVINNKI